MWWLTAPAAGLLGKLIIGSSSKPSPPAKKLSILEQNLVRLQRELRLKIGTKVAIIGQPGAGKSSLLKKMTNGKITPLPQIGTETDATNWGHDNDCNLLSSFRNYTFVDVPGYDTTTHPANTIVAAFPFEEFDVFIFVVRGKLRSADEDVFHAIVRSNKPVCVARSFIESCSDEEQKEICVDLQRRLNLDADHHIGFFSNRTGKGIKAILKAISIK